MSRSTGTSRNPQQPDAPEGCFSFTIPRVDGAALPLAVDAGEMLFVVGANGSGKSSLMQRLYVAHRARAERITAHRRTWFESGTISITASNSRDYTTNISNEDAQLYSRWKDTYSQQRVQITLYRLVDAENVRGRAIAAAHDDGDAALAQKIAKNIGPLAQINRILHGSNIPIALSIRAGDEVVASRSGSPPYSVAELSDGERNALLIATQVLGARPGTLLLIDEPERHLHRSISAPLLSALFAERTDCAFVVSTHELNLPLDNPAAKTLLVRGCTYVSNKEVTWDCDVLDPGSDIDEPTKLAILGARRKVVFVEGTRDSLDTRFYGLVFPDATIIPKGSCRDVENAVAGIRGASDLAYVQAFGIVDNDHRSTDDVERLRMAGVFPLRHYSVESIYYHPEIQRRVAERRAEHTESDAAKQREEARATALREIQKSATHLAERIAERRLRNDVLSRLPTGEAMRAGVPVTTPVDPGKIIREEDARIKEAIADGDLDALLERYPVRESGALTQIAKHLGFQGRHEYEGAVRKLLQDEPEALGFVRSLFEGLEAELVASWKPDGSDAPRAPAAVGVPVAS